MKSISKEEAEKYFRDKETLAHVDDRVFDSIKNGNNFYLFEITDKATFMSLIWQEVGVSRILTPEGKSRTLADVAKRMSDFGYSFHDLSNESKKYQDEYDPSWFNTCRKIDEEFDFNKFVWLVLVLPNESEKKQSPDGTFYIHDGVHRSLVLAKKLFYGETKYQKIKALLIVPRPN
jgi:hypothetical protein